MESASNKKAKNPKEWGLKSRFVAALAAFGLLCGGLAAGSIGKTAPDDFPVNTWTTWAIKDFLSPDRKADVVFMGSSLMLVPLDGVDADFLGHRIDASKHHQSCFFEDRFAAYSGLKVKSFNFALPGEMPSDAALITKFLLKGEKKPRVLVYGVGPRDFMDSLLPSPAATDPFQYLSRFGDWSDRVALIVPQWQERLNYELGRLVYPYGIRGQMAHNSEKAARGLIDGLLAPRSTKSKAELIALRREVLPEYHPFEVNRDECFFRPTKPEEKPKFDDNVGEYKKRYSKLKAETFNGQMQFLEDILSTAQERDIHVVLVAMPITDINRQLLPDANWNLYRTRLRELAAGYGNTSFFDMHDTGAFKLSDFQDTVHLHSGGGAKLLDRVAHVMAEDSPSTAALREAETPELARFREDTRKEAMRRLKEPAL